MSEISPIFARRFLDVEEPIHKARGAGIVVERMFGAVFGEHSYRRDLLDASGNSPMTHRVYLVPDEAFGALEVAIEHMADAGRELVQAYEGNEPAPVTRDAPHAADPSPSARKPTGKELDELLEIQITVKHAYDLVMLCALAAPRLNEEGEGGGLAAIETVQYAALKDLGEAWELLKRFTGVAD